MSDVDNSQTPGAGDVNTVSKEEFDKLQEQLKAVTQTQSGYDKVIAKQKADLEAKELEIAEIKKKSETEKLTAEEQLKAQIEEINSKLTAAERKAQREHLANLVKDGAAQLGIPFGLVDGYNGDIESLPAYLENKKKLFDEETTKKVNMIINSEGHKPKGGTEPEGTWNPDNHSNKENMEYYEKLFST
jgi:chromosome segregation ATPase